MECLLTEFYLLTHGRVPVLSLFVLDSRRATATVVPLPESSNLIYITKCPARGVAILHTYECGKSYTGVGVSVRALYIRS